MAKLWIDNGYHVRVLERAYRGELVSNDHSRTVNFWMTHSIEVPEGKVGFATTVKVDKSTHSDEQAALAYARNWLSVELPRAFQQGHGHFNVYGCRWCTAADTAKDVLPAVSPVVLEFDCSPPARAHLVETIAHLESVKRAFSAARTKIDDWAYHNTPHGFKATLGMACGLFSKLEQVLSCSGEGQGGSKPSHVRNARSNYEELARRSRESNSTYQHHLRDLQRFALALRFPAVWDRRPQVPS